MSTDPREAARRIVEWYDTYPLDGDKTNDTYVVARALLSGLPPAAGLQEALQEIARLRERLGPVGLEMIEINDAGHYVNEKVKAEIERLRASRDELLAALEACGAEWRSPPCTVGEGTTFLYQEFVRRAELARATIARAKGETT